MPKFKPKTKGRTRRQKRRAAQEQALRDKGVKDPARVSRAKAKAILGWS
jgi:hypothetical protein